MFLFAPASLEGHAQRLNGWLAETLQLAEIAERFREAGLEPTPLGLEQARQAIAERMHRVDAMRLAVFGRTR